jgi:hypothetical protein
MKDPHDTTSFKTYSQDSTRYTVEVTELLLTNRPWNTLQAASRYINQSSLADQLNGLGSVGYQAVLYSDPGANSDQVKWSRLVIIPPSGIPLKSGVLTNSSTNVLAAASRTNLNSAQVSSPVSAGGQNQPGVGESKPAILR